MNCNQQSPIFFRTVLSVRSLNLSILSFRSSFLVTKKYNNYVHFLSLSPHELLVDKNSANVKHCEFSTFNSSENNWLYKLTDHHRIFSFRF